MVSVTREETEGLLQPSMLLRADMERNRVEVRARITGKHAQEPLLPRPPHLLSWGRGRSSLPRVFSPPSQFLLIPHCPHSPSMMFLSFSSRPSTKCCPASPRYTQPITDPAGQLAPDTVPPSTSLPAWPCVPKCDNTQGGCEAPAKLPTSNHCVGRGWARAAGSPHRHSRPTLSRQCPAATWLIQQQLGLRPSCCGAQRAHGVVTHQ